MDDLEKINKHQAKHAGIPEFTTTTGNAVRRAVLKENQQMREGVIPGARNFGTAGGFGRVQMRIPELDYAVILRMFPELNSTDATTRTKAWQRFAKSPLSEPYRVEEKKRGRIYVPNV